MQARRDDTAVLYVSAPDDPAEIKRAWERLEEVVPLRGRRFIGAVWVDDGMYWAGVERLPDEVPGELEEGVVPGGTFLRMKLHGEPPGIYDRIAPTFSNMFGYWPRDPSRPLIEYYRRRDKIELFMPI